MRSSSAIWTAAVAVVLVLPAFRTTEGQFSGMERPGTGSGASSPQRPSFGGGQQPEMPDYSGNSDPFSPRNNRYGSPAVRRATEPRGGYVPDSIQRDPQSGLQRPSSIIQPQDSEAELRSPISEPRSPWNAQESWNGMEGPGARRFATPIYGGSSAQRDPGWQQVQQFLANGKTLDAQQVIEQRLQKNRSLHGLMDAVTVLEGVQTDPEVYQRYRREALELARQQMSSDVNDPLPWVAAAKFSLEDEDDESFRTAADSLAARFPDDKFSHYFQGIAATHDGDWSKAEASLRRAQELGIPGENVAQWLKTAIDNQRWVWQYAWIVLWALVGWIACLAVLYLAGKLLCRSTLRSLATSQFAHPSPWQRTLGSAYRTVILLAGLFYFLSLPVLVVISIAAPLAVCYALLHVPAISLWLIALVVVVSIGSILTALSGIMACFVPLDRRLPGRQIPKNENVKLWQLVQEVAKRVDTKPVDVIWLAPSAVIGVFERGGFLRRLMNRSERVLILGAATLEGFSQRALRSVLAHEYGHFHHGDTAGGDIALRVNHAMDSFAESLIARGKVRWWHLAVQFLRFYYVLFNRLTFGASRLQEIMADRIAVTAYGPAAFEEGLTHAIRRSLEFEYWTALRLREFVRGKTPSTALLQTDERPAPIALEGIETALREIVNRETTEHDTHPSPRDRFAFAKSLGIGNPQDQGRMVWELFQDPERLCGSACKEMDAQLNAEAEVVNSITRAKLHYLGEVIKQTPSCQAYETRALIHLEVGDFDAALSDLEKSLSRAPHEIDPQIGKALTWHAAKDYSSAGRELSKLLERSEKSRTADSWFILGDCYFQLGHHAEAEGAFSKSLHLKWIAGTALLRGQARVLVGQIESGIDDFSEIVRRFPESSEAYVERGLANELAGRRDPALEDLRKATSLAVAYPRAHREYARLLLSNPLRTSEQTREAVRHARTACASALNHAKSLPVLIDALIATGEYDDACRGIDQLIDALPPDQRADWVSRREQLEVKKASQQFSSSAEVCSTVWA
jgi:tetratricopeptide (TPR) repeat protein/Zn-dependent protease with chaperone function